MKYSSNKKMPLVFRLFFVISFALSLGLVFQPEVKSSLRGMLVPDQRIVLSTMTARLSFDEAPYQFVKVKSREGLRLEVYKNNEAGELTLLDKLLLSQHKDAHFTFNGESTNLAIDDINGDQLPELLVPSIDASLIAHLNVFKFNIATQKLEIISPNQIK